MDPQLVAAQIQAVTSDMSLAAIKIGMLGNAEIVRAVADAIDGLAVPVVLDPILWASSGAALLDVSALQALRSELAPRATVVTPNLAEGRALQDCDEPDAVVLADMLGTPVLLTGGHLAGDDVVDTLAFPGEPEGEISTARRIPTPHDHGTGCLLSTSIACGLASGLSLRAAVQHGRACVRAGLHAGRGLGERAGAVLLLALPGSDEAGASDP